MTLQRRVILLLLASAPIVWGIALALSYLGSNHEINELFDTQLIPAGAPGAVDAAAGVDRCDRCPAAHRNGQASMGDAELEDLAIAVWDRDGKLLLVDREGVLLPYQADATGFVDLELGKAPAKPHRWRVYYLQQSAGEWLIAVGQSSHERDELVWDLIAGQLLPWALTLPI